MNWEKKKKSAIGNRMTEEVAEHIQGRKKSKRFGFFSVMMMQGWSQSSWKIIIANYFSSVIQTSNIYLTLQEMMSQPLVQSAVQQHRATSQ